MSVTLTQALSKIGDENIRLQFISQSLISFKETKADLEICFATEKQNKPLDNNQKIGIVIWIDKDRYLAAIESLKESAQDQS